MVYRQNEAGLPAGAQHLIVTRDVNHPDQLKYFLSNAPANATLGSLLKVAYGRWAVERCFQDDKSYIGLNQFEGRTYPGLLRHLILSAVTLLFLARMREKFLDRFPELTISQAKQAMSALVETWFLPLEATVVILEKASRTLKYYQRRNAAARKSHTKTRKRKLAEMGIDLSTINRCQWDTG